MNIFSKSSVAITLLLLFTTMGSNAASVESEVSDTDTVVIGAVSEKVTLRVTGFKNLKGNEYEYGKLFASTSSANGKIALTFSPENEPTYLFDNGTRILQGKITNQDGDKFSVKFTLDDHSTDVREINGTFWLIALGNVSSGTLMKVYDTLKPGVYPITIRAALYQE